LGTKLSDLVDNPDATWAGFTGPLRLRVVFPRGRAGHNESLISSGKKGASDTLFVHYDSDRSIRFGYARTGDPDVLTRPVAIEPGAIQELLLSSGALMPPEKSELYSSDPELDALRSFIHVGLNGKPLLHEYAEPFPAGDGAIWIGASPLVDADGDGKFQGTVETIMRTRPMDVFEDGALGKSFARPGWQGYPGPLRIRMTFPRGSPGEGQPIVTTGLRGIGDILFLRYGANGMARVGQDHWGSQLLLSAPFELTVGVPHTLVVSFGALYPPSDTVLVSAPPELGALRKKTVVLFDGQPVLSSDEPSHPSAPENITVGANLIGGTTARSLFSGVVDQVLPASLDAVGP
jgi:hypothetical protein